MKICMFFVTIVWCLLRNPMKVALENGTLRYQVTLMTHSGQRPKIRPSDRFFIALLTRLWRGGVSCIHIVEPATLVKWHRNLFRFYWRWKSRAKSGRMPIDAKMIDLIRKISRENPIKKAGQIRSIIKLLGQIPPDLKTIRKYMIRSDDPDRRQRWRTFIANHMHSTWAMDFFTIPTFTCSILYIFVVIDHGRRQVVHFATSYNPMMQWVIQQLREATAFGRQPKYLIRDNDGIYGNGVGEFLARSGIKDIPTSFHSPWQNAFVERFGGTLRRELLDHVIVFSQKHLDTLLAEFINDYYNTARPHQGIDGDTPIPQPKLADDSPGVIESRQVLNGLHCTYRRVAA